MKFSFTDLFDLVKEIILNPVSFWNSRREVRENQVVLFVQFLMPMIIAATIAVFLGEFFSSSHFYMGFAVLKALRETVLFISTYFLAVYFTNELMKSFGAEKNIDISRQLVAYSMTPLILVSMVTGLFRFLYVLEIAGMYGFYIFWIGARELLAVPEQKKDSFIIITIVVNFLVFSFLSILLSKLLTIYF